jgi:hypothetical protein
MRRETKQSVCRLGLTHGGLQAGCGATNDPLQEETSQGHVTGVCRSAEFFVPLFAKGKPT